MGDAFTALSTIVAGMGVWGAIGYGLDRLLGTDPVLLVIGVLLGHFAAIYLVYVRSKPQETRDAS
jgi:F0F1-type ATP synthase assembly protein I